MSTRRTEVEWDPTLTRVEYLDDKGQPYYCSFEKNADQAAEIPVAPAGELPTTTSPPPAARHRVLLFTAGPAHRYRRIGRAFLALLGWRRGLWPGLARRSRGS
jgi:hypothetical protein